MKGIIVVRNTEENTNLHCPNCGAPVTTEICQYCHAITGLDTNSANMEYPVIDCKEANLGFWSVGFPMIFAIFFGMPGIVIPIAIGDIRSALFASLFAITGITAFIIALNTFIRYLKVNNKGKEIEATVYGYMDDKVLLNGRPAQIVKLLVDTNDGLKFILYQLGNIDQPYKVNSKIKLKVYKNYFLIVKDNKNYF